jgi:hypothetical protein
VIDAPVSISIDRAESEAIEFFTKALPRSGRAQSNGVDADAEDLSCLFVGQGFPHEQLEHFLVRWPQPGKRNPDESAAIAVALFLP